MRPAGYWAHPEQAQHLALGLWLAANAASQEKTRTTTPLPIPKKPSP